MIETQAPALARILIVEDEGVIAKDIQNSLRRLGYAVPVIASSGEEAIQKTAETTPDLVLMDIVLKGSIDGIEAAELIRSRFQIPVVYLTAYADENTLRRAKITEPFGYILKPFEENELHTTIDIALYKHKMERKLREREQWLGTTLRSIADGVVTTDGHGRVTFMNPVAERITGWVQEEARGRHLLDVFRVIDEETRETAKLPLDRALGDGSTLTLGEHTLLIARDGSETPIDDSAAPIRDEMGNITGIVLVFRDVTQHRLAERAIQQAMKMEAVGRLAGGIAHDFNNMLNIITSFADLMMKRAGTEGPLRRYAEEIISATERAASLVSELLSFSRRDVPQLEHLNLNDIVESLDEMLRPLVGEHVALITALDPRLGDVRADINQLKHIIVNLADNARDVMPQGGTLVLRTANAVITDSDTDMMLPLDPGEYVMLSIADTGAGIDVAVRRQIFEPFFTTKEKGKGTGLGLSTVYAIVSQSGGNIRVTTEQGAGTTFEIYLPRAEGKKRARSSREAPLEELPQGFETILLVEDQSKLRSATREIIEMCGYNVIEAKDGEEALVVARDHKDTIHLLLTDVVMPGMNGRELAERLRSIHPETRVLFVSGHTEDSIVRQGVLEGDLPFLKKPFRPGTLACLIRETIDATEPAD